jgi:hypothetical protein
MRVAVCVDHSRTRMTRRLQGSLEEAASRSRIPHIRKPEVERGTLGTDGTIDGSKAVSA